MEKKDYKYIIVILIMLIITIFTFFFGGKENDIVSYLGFAGTITSIILSIIAVIYTFFQSVTSVSTAQKLSETSEQLENVYEEFKSTQTQLAETVDNIGLISNQVAMVEERVIELRSDVLKSQNRNSERLGVNESEIENLIKRASASGLMILYICYLQYKNPRQVDFSGLFSEISKRFQSINAEYAYGFAVGFSCTSVIFVNNDNVMNVEIQNPDLFIQLLEQEILIRKVDSAVGNFISEAYETIKTMYKS